MSEPPGALSSQGRRSPLHPPELIDSYDRSHEFDCERGILGAPTQSVIAALEHGA